SLNHIRHVIKSDMKNFKLRYLAAHNHWKQGNFDSAIVHFERTIKTDPSKPGPYIDYALMQIHRRYLGTARKIALRGIQNLTDHKVSIPSKLYNILSRINLLENNAKKALEYAEKAKSVFDQKETGVKDKLEAVVLEARAHLSLADYEKAEFSMLWGLSFRKQSPYLHNLLGYIYQQWYKSEKTKSPEKADELKKKAIEHFNIALNNPNLVPSFKKLIQTNIDNLK
ncbi:MAG: hypothetical protein ABUK01_15935, partial [Leptospirales bacterium]